MNPRSFSYPATDGLYHTVTRIPYRSKTEKGQASNEIELLRASVQETMSPITLSLVDDGRAFLLHYTQDPESIKPWNWQRQKSTVK